MSGLDRACPGCTTMRSTRPSVAAGIQRISSGTSVPSPRTWRTIGPRFTVSITTAERETDGAAGFRWASAIVVAATAAATIEPTTIRRLRRSRAAFGRGMSMEASLTQGACHGRPGRAMP